MLDSAPKFIAIDEEANDQHPGTQAQPYAKASMPPILVQSVGFGPVSPPAGGLGHRAVHAQPVPVNALQLVKLGHSRLPKWPEDVRFYPLLNPVVCSGLGT